ncbi:major facilitator superfamily domain-containing protein [Microdochium trichocladiopsis]|uniref:Major facilitator superfamily domain-containing protein n=1 Tax=Microdochium trichocladiopsis TaxID=1682393 RepID=A0A9P8Y6L8_9PEZI|nr:major facilitator superfamily domain-containing protein [Microdochium trichocladiopsis]KAH7030883.1 major facilitator superfamily domain-containing protein [Microdochium trichocladiopsis]
MQSPTDARRLPPFPKKQMLVLAICRICEPIAFMGIFPYIYYMVRDFQITDDESKISLYAGLVTSAFTFAEFATGLFWGRLSDRVGRKPVLLTGLIGTAISVVAFGFAPNLLTAIIARAIGGLLNGNMGVLQTTVAELITVKEHQPRAYTIMPVVWCLGSIVGPMIGGALARPCDSYPRLFPPGTIWDRYPYLLPNVFSALVVLVGVANGLLFLEETHAEKKQKRDRGIEIGRWILDRISVSKLSDAKTSSRLQPGHDEERPLLEVSDTQSPPPGYQTREGSPSCSPRLGPLDDFKLPPQERPEKAVIFTRQVVLNIMSFGILAFHTMTFDQLFPIFLSTSPPANKQPDHLPFKFVGGFGLDTQANGIILSLQGIYSLLINVVLVPAVIKRLGALRLFRLLTVAYFSLYLVTPYLVLLPERHRMIGVAIILVWKCTFANMAYPSNAILTADSAPSHLALGTINGVAASTASLCRAFGPTLAGFLYAVGLKSGYSGLAWWCSGLVSIAGAVVAFKVKQQHHLPTEKRPSQPVDPENVDSAQVCLGQVAPRDLTTA